MEQQIRFCTAADGVRIAYATVGAGPPLVKAANWLNHLEFDWKSPIWRPWFQELARDHTLVRYDERGNGLSDWNAADLSFAAFVRDLESVVDAAGLQHFPLLGISQGGAVAIDYAARHPEKVSHLVLYGAYALGWAKRADISPGERERKEAMVTLIRQGWGQDNPAFRQMWTSLYMPEASAEHMRWFNELQRISTSPENAARLTLVLGGIDVTDLLPLVRVPTLVLHCREDAAVPFEAGRGMAARIPGARFVELPGKNHLLLESDPGWPRFVEEVREFLGAPRSAAARASDSTAAHGARPVSRSGIAPGDRLLHYRLLSQLGAGGMGVVYRARDSRLERDVAIKVLPAALTQDPVARARLLREAQTASALSHPNICHIYEVGEAEGHSFIAMELVAGRPLAAEVAGGLPVDSVVRYGEQIADALAHAHDRNVLHRDLKSANVILTPEGRIKILDFGLAKRVEQDLQEAATQSEVSPLTQAGSIAGTLHYLAPEVLSGAPADARSDVWALGVVLYEMAAGALPFTGRTSFEVSSAILREPAPALPPRVPPGLRAVVQRCLAKVPAQRYQRAGEVRAALEALSSSAHVPMAIPSTAEMPLPPQQGKQPPPQAKPWWRDDAYAMTFGVLLLILSGLLIAGVLYWQSGTRLDSANPSSATLAPAPAGSGLAVPAAPVGGRLSGGGKPSPNSEANAYFEKAMLFMHSRFELQRAIPLLKRALEHDPKFPEARAVLGLTHLLQVESGISNERSWVYEAEKELRRALQDDPQCAAAHAILGGVYLYQGRKEEGFEETTKALALSPGQISTVPWRTWLLERRGDYAGAMALARKNMEINPVFFPSQWALGELLVETGDLAGGVRQLGKVLEQDAQNHFVLTSLARMHIESGDTKTARLFFEEIRKSDQTNYRVRLMKALLMAHEGKRREALKQMDEAVQKYAEVCPRVTLQAAEFYSVLGTRPGNALERQQALEWLERAVRAGDERIEWFQRNRLLDNIREEPRFKQIVDSIAYLRTQRRSPGNK